MKHPSIVSCSSRRIKQQGHVRPRSRRLAIPDMLLITIILFMLCIDITQAYITHTSSVYYQQTNNKRGRRSVIIIPHATVAGPEDTAAVTSTGGGGDSPVISTSTSSTKEQYAEKTGLRIRPARKRDLTSVATMQVLEYGGDDSLMFIWHWLQVRT